MTWENGNLIGEGLFCKVDGDDGVVICHPHPQMGGSMYNNVVEALQILFANHRYSTLRFNFRGVGGSTGFYDEGKGECKDVLAARAFLQKQGVKKIYLAGYSFGAWVISNVLKETYGLFEKAFMISPPDKFVQFDWNGLENAVEAIVCGEADPFCDTQNLKKIAQKIHADFISLESVDHFYLSREKELSRRLEPLVERHIKKM